MLWVFSNILTQRGHWITKLIAEYWAEDLTSAVVSYVTLKEVVHGMICLSEWHRGLHFRDVISAWRYSLFFFGLIFLKTGLNFSNGGEIFKPI